MKTNNLFRLSILALLLGLAGACTTTKPPKAAADPLEKAGIPFHEKTFRIKSTKVAEGMDSTYFYLSYPVFTDSLINRYVMQTTVLDTSGSSVEAMGEDFIKQYDAFYDQAEFKRPWYQESRVSVIYQSEHFIGLKTLFESYTGGAHGIHYTLYNNYDVRRKREVSLSDLVDDKDKLRAIAEKEFRKQEGLTSQQTLKDAYFFQDDTFSLPEPFTFTKDGVLFLYNVYEIKPYVAGITKLQIPYEDLSEILTPNGKEMISEIKESLHADL